MTYNMNEWLAGMKGTHSKKPMPVLSFPWALTQRKVQSAVTSLSSGVFTTAVMGLPSPRAVKI